MHTQSLEGHPDNFSLSGWLASTEGPELSDTGVSLGSGLPNLILGELLGAPLWIGIRQ